MSSSCASFVSSLSPTVGGSSSSGTSGGSAFIGGSLTTGATLLLFHELILPAVGPDLLGFAADGLGLGLFDVGVSLAISLYLTPVLTLHGFLPVQTGVWAHLDLVKGSPTSRSEAAVGGTL